MLELPIEIAPKPPLYILLPQYRPPPSVGVGGTVFIKLVGMIHSIDTLPPWGWGHCIYKVSWEDPQYRPPPSVGVGGTVFIKLVGRIHSIDILPFFQPAVEFNPLFLFIFFFFKIVEFRHPLFFLFGNLDIFATLDLCFS